MYSTVFLAVSEGECLAVFVEKWDCEEFCEKNGCELIVINREDVHQYL